MTTISASASFIAQQLPEPQTSFPINNGATDCFPADMMDGFQANQAGQDAGSQAAGIIGDCTPMPEDGWPGLNNNANLEDVLSGGLDTQGPVVVQPGDTAAGIIGDCTPMPEGWPFERSEATVRDELYMDDQGQIGSRKVVDAGEGDDSVQVTRHADGSATVTVNGERTELTPEEARNMRVTGGEGNDTITVVDNRDPTTQLVDSVLGSDVKVQGGDGADRFEGQVDGTTLDNNPFEGDTVNGKHFP